METAAYNFCRDIENETHVLVGGAAGSGKSVLINDFLWSLHGIYEPSFLELYLIDPKKVELVDYKASPSCAGYADSVESAVRMLTDLVSVMDFRYSVMQREGVKEWRYQHTWVIIDELADLMTTAKKEIMPLLQRIAQLGRAAHIHLFCATQSPSRQTIPAALTLNFSCKIALRCDSAIESRQIIGEAGAEDLPRYGEALIKRPGYSVYRQGIPMLPDDAIRSRISALAAEFPRTPAKVEDHSLRTALLGMLGAAATALVTAALLV